MFTVERHIWRTASGELVEHGHPDAAVLAYAAGDQVPDEIAAKDRLSRFAKKSTPKPEDKAVAAPANKAAAKPAAKPTP
jgi:hypothetical protein